MLKIATRIILTAVVSLGTVSLIMSTAQAAEVIPSLELRVNRLNGVTRITTTGTPATNPDTNGTADLDSYEIGSNPANPPLENVWIPASWNSITDQDGGTWTEVSSVAPLTEQQLLSELNLSSSKPFAFGDIVSLGSIYDTADTEEDVTFTYGLAGSATPLVGNVVFEGLIVTPTFELRVNRLTGLTRIVGVGGSTDPADVNVPADLDSYEIASNAASLPLEDVWIPANWNSITNQDGGGWTEVPPVAPLTEQHLLSELNLTGSKSVSSGDVISLGDIYDTTDIEEDVTFTYGLAGDATPLVGNVVFEGLIVTPALELHVNRFTGETRIVGTGGSTDPADQNVPADLDSYEIASNSANLPLENVWIPANWNSITDQDGGGWTEVPPVAPLTEQQLLSELSLTGSKPVASGDVIPLGTIYDITDSQDITFIYGLAGNVTPITGNVVFDGVGLRLRVNKSTGKIELVNAETAGIDFDAYIIQSVSGDLNVTTWNSLEDQTVPGWEETNSTSLAISELNLTSSSVLAGAGALDLGAAYQGGVGGVEDLSFVYNLRGAEVASGVVEYIIAGDMDGDGDVDTADVPLFVQAMVDRAAYDANGFTNLAGFLVDADIVGDVDGSDTFDLGDLSAFGAIFAPATASASASAVPEPSSMILLGIALGILTFRRRKPSS